MLEKATVINTDQFGPLKSSFPLGHEIVTDSNVVMLVGPNGAGKTGLLRMIYSSLGFNRYYEQHDISQWWHWYGLDNLAGKFFEPGFHGLSEKIPTIPLSREVGAKSAEIRAGLNAGDVTPDLRSGFKKIRLQLGPYPQIENTGRNRWIINDGGRVYEYTTERHKDVDLGYINVLSSEHVSICCSRDEEYLINANYEKRNVRLNDTTLTFLASDPRFNVDPDDCVESQGCLFIPRKVLEEVQRAKDVFTERTDLNLWGYLNLSMDNVPTYAKMILPRPGSRYDGKLENEPTYADFLIEYLQERAEPKSVGLTQLQYIEKQLQAVQDFFDKKTMATPNTKGFMNIIDSGKPLDIEENAHLLLLVDEPTIALDYANLFKVRDIILEAVKKYSPRLQVFIATNDPVLIEKTPGCKFISLYSQPAASLPNFAELQRSLPQT